MRSKLLNISIANIGCIGPEALTVSLDNILCLVGDNNTGKSTILRAYELAVGTQDYSHEKDYCKRSSGENAYVEISVHIPEGTANIAEKWKEIQEDYRVVKSRWEWDALGKKTRKTYDPDLKAYSEEGNAAGLDAVFNSRLPEPFRIGALDKPKEELKNLLKLIVAPISEELNANLANKDSELSRSIDTFSEHAKKIVNKYKEVIDKINARITNSHSKIFPNLSIGVNIDIANPKIDPLESLIKGSDLNIQEYKETIGWEQQGTGSQRALFWSLLQVRSKLQGVKKSQTETSKRISALDKEIKKLEKEKEKAKTDDLRLNKENEIAEKTEEIRLLRELIGDNGLDLEKIDRNNDDIALPGYMLLIDEPEIALHPNGIRAASKYLYELANDPAWQVMITTHSPLFINPFENHTTIVRLSRNAGNPHPHTYRTDEIKFSHDEMENLKLLNSFDQNLSEMFFGQFPIIVEGDTEYAAFEKIMKMNQDKFHLNHRPILVRARGKFTIIPLIKMLQHFKVNFSVLHDSDYPKNKKGNVNNVWTGNNDIYKAIVDARNKGLKVVHRISISTFETAHDSVDVDNDGNYVSGISKDKPWTLYQKIENNENLRKSVECMLDELINENSREEPFDVIFSEGLIPRFQSWVDENQIKDPRFVV